MQAYWDNENAQNLTGAMVLLVVGALAVYLTLDERSTRDPVVLAVAILCIAVVAVFLLFVSSWTMSSRKRIISVLWLEAALIVPLYFLVDISFIAILGIVWIVQAAETFDIRRTSWLLGGASLIFALSQFYHWYAIDAALAVVSSLTLAMFHLFAVITTHRANREQLLREQTAALNRELIATRELLTQSSRQSERLRIARDLHDLLGHHMTALILNLEVATHCTEGKALQKVEQSLALGKLLLSDLRTAVSELRDSDTIDLKQSVEKLIADIPHPAITLDFTAAPAIHDVELAETLLRCIQEAVTNVLKHSRASRCRIALAQAYNEFFLTVQDNGRPGKSVEAGNGLKGMQERAIAAGGEVTWSRDQEGFLLQLRLPAGASA